MLVQISKVEGEIKRVKPGVTPVIELHLEPHQYVANVELHKTYQWGAERKTDDWQYTAMIVSNLGSPDEEYVGRYVAGLKNIKAEEIKA